MTKKVLVLYTSIGLGHKTIAENIGAYLQSQGFEVRLEDILQVQAGRLISISTATHQFINRYLPFVWKWLYFGTNSWVAAATLPLRIGLAGKNCQNIRQVLEEFRPDVVITTQTTASAVISFLKRKGEYKGLFGIAFSDFHLHRFWLYPQADFFLANTEEQEKEMQLLGYGTKKIFLCGMTVKPKSEVDVAETRAVLGVREGEQAVLVGIGSLGIGLNNSMLDQLSKLEKTKIIVVCGKNRLLKKELEKKYEGQNVTVLGFHSPMAQLYAIADVFITKPGGLSTAESLQWQLPAFITHMLPGQEELNIKYLVKNKLIVFQPFSLDAVRQELQTHAFRNHLKANPSVARIIDAPGLREAANWLVAQKR